MKKILQSVFYLFLFFVLVLGSYNASAQITQGTWQCSNGLPLAEIDWNEHSGASSYQILRGGVQIATVSAPQTFYTDSSVTYNTYYEYQIIPNNEQATQRINVQTGSCVAVVSLTGSTSVTAGSSSSYTTDFVYGYKPGTLNTQLYVINPAGTQVWIGGGSDPITASYTFPSAGTYTIKSEGIIYESNSVPGSVLQGSRTMTVTVAPLPPTDGPATININASSCAAASWSLSPDILGSSKSGVGTGPANVRVASGGTNFSLTVSSPSGSTITNSKGGGASMNVVPNDSNATYYISCPMSGTLTASNCTIASGASSCNSNIVWSVSNPESSNTAVTTPTNTTVGTGHSGSTTYSISHGTRWFFLYNNAKELAQALATATCVSGTDWVSGACRAKPTITVTQASNGTISPPGVTSVVYGTNSTTLTLTPSSGYVVASHIINGVSTTTSATSYTFTNITSNQTFSATFALKSYTVTGTAGPGGTISPSYRTVNHGSTTTFTVTPTTGYYIASASGCNGSLSGTTYTTGAITAACTVSATFSATPVMYGTLSASPCTIASGASSCNSNIVWSVSNPESSNTAVTTPTNTTVGTGHSGSTTYSISHGTRWFFLYNNAQELAQALATATCTSGTTWSGTMCATGGGGSPMSGTLTSASSFCDILLGNNSCNVNMSWSITNPEGTPTAITASGMSNINVSNTLATPQSGTVSVVVPYNNRTFFLYNNGKSLVPTSPSGTGINVLSRCISGTTWSGTMCVADGGGGGGGDGGGGNGNCSDGIQNGDETGIDTGGRCDRKIPIFEEN